MELSVQAGPSLDPVTLARVRTRTIFEHHKWDPQVEDVSVLAPFPIVLSRVEWETIAGAAERLAREALHAEAEICARPELVAKLGLSRTLRNLVTSGSCAQGPRFMRFDFHPTSEGWRISEANTDVPGGFIEASGFATTMAEQYPGLTTVGDPAAALAAALAAQHRRGARIGLAHATAYVDDRQVMMFLAKQLRAAGLEPLLISPADLEWSGGIAHCEGAPLDAIIRFFPGEWLPNLRRSTDWSCFFRGSRTPISNPASSLVVQSKRFPLVWNELRADVSSWRAWLPETRGPREAPWKKSNDWVLKPALGRVGEDIAIAGVTGAKETKRIHRAVRWDPGSWIAQRRFSSTAIEAPDGPCHLCIGVFTIDGRAAGAYGRIAQSPLIDYKARDVAVLVAGESA